jgi:hypothetical protein
MARQYSDELLLLVSQQPDDGGAKLGFKLAKMCVALNIPTRYAAAAVGVSRMTIHKWFRGGNIAASKQGVVTEFCNFLVECGSSDSFLAAGRHERISKIGSWAQQTPDVAAH